VKRVAIGTGAATTLALAAGNAVDCEAQIASNAMVCRKNDHQVFGTTGNPNVVFGINLSGFCTPVALGPQDGEWDPIKRRLFVLAEDGINACYGSYFAGNHLVRFQVPAGGPNPPVVITPTSGSLILGAGGDLCVVHDDFAYSGIYGEPCAAGAGMPLLDQVDGLFALPEIGNASFTLALSGAPPSAPALLLVGATATDLPLLPCPLLVAPSLLVPLGAASPSGELAIPAAIPNDPQLLGIDLWLQAVVGTAGGGSQLTPGLRVHLGK
jgi:hypothetical protein